MQELGVLTGWQPSFRSSSARRMALCLGLVPGLVSASFASEQRIKDLLEAHSSSVALVRQLDAEMEFTSQMLVGTLAGKEPIPTVRWRWSFDSTR